MSLQVDDGGRRGRSRSPSGRERERSRSRNPPNVVDATPYPEEDAMAPGPRAYDYEPREDRYSSYDQPPRSPVDDSSYRRSRETVDVKYSDGRRDKEYRYERASDSPRDKVLDQDRLSFLPQKYAKKTDPARDSDRERDRPRDKERSRKERYEEDLAYGSGPPPSNKSSRPESPPSRYSRPEEAPSSKYSRPEEPSSSYSYAQPKPWEYAKTEEHASYRPSRDSLGVEPRSSGRGRSPSPGPGAREKQYRNSYAGDGRESSASLVTVEPGASSRRRDKSPQPPMGRDRSPQPPMARDRSPQPPVARMSSLSVNTGQGHGRTLSLSAAPASPLLESYHGTYQSMSPMPSPMLLPSQAGGGPGDSHILDVSPVGSEDERSGGKKQRRRARFTDPEDDASRLAKALKGHDRPDTQPLIEILPGLTHEQVMELRTEYKRLVKTGPDRKGVNIAKHIRARLKDEDPNLMKACYATALGKWESEAYWANFWYQGDKTRRELLIESLMGRSNDEIRMIKDGFSDKKYDNSLTKCMKTELKEDKFKRAVLLVLDEQRMEDMDRYGRPLPLDGRLIEDDVRTLRKAVKAEKGGESAMINIVVQRSDSHLREVLKLYNADYGSNFARDALKKSGNLVGELLAHILNGVINKPVRDALLLHHAVTASKRDELRRELLISRLIRFHWDGHHMAAIKAAYRERYGKDLQEAVRDATSGSGWGEFCRELCITRMPDDVRRVERISSSRR